MKLKFYREKKQLNIANRSNYKNLTKKSWTNLTYKHNKRTKVRNFTQIPIVNRNLTENYWNLTKISFKKSKWEKNQSLTPSIQKKKFDKQSKSIKNRNLKIENQEQIEKRNLCFSVVWCLIYNWMSSRIGLKFGQ